MNQGSDAVSPEFSSVASVRPVASGRYRAAVTEHWLQGRGAFGGLVAGIFARAMRAELATRGDPGQLRTLTCHLCEPVPPAALVLAVEVIRVGKLVRHVSARLYSERDVLLAIASATFASARPEVGLSFDHAQPPAHAPMEDSPVVLHSGLEPVFCRNFEYRFAGGSPPFSLGDPAAFVGWTRLRGSAEPLDEALAAAYLDSWPPAVFVKTAGPRPAATMAITYHFVRALPDREREPGAAYLVTAAAREAVDGYSAQDNELWTADGQLLARAHQVFALIK
ncbi:MAG: thioesterase family protein [Myxococcales bacterium]|nr:thioesterase family protein [Myxococcales bacterium]MCB9754827.1 thioesterase family protein [Myxococcales bacterium]